MSLDKIHHAEGDTTQRILAAALQVFLDKGYSGATTRAIAVMADVNEVTLFRHFGNKKNLMAAVVERYSPLKGLQTLMTEQLTGDFQQDLRELSDYIVKNMAEQSDIMRLVMYESHQVPELREMLQSIPHQFLLSLADYFKRQSLNGQIRSDVHPTLMAQSFLGFFASFGVSVRVVRERHLELPVPVDAAKAQLLEVFLHGIATPVL